MKAVSTTNESTSNYPNWHLQSTQLVLENLKTNENGLTDAAVKSRINQYGLNTIRLGSAKPAWKILVAQFTDVMIVILMVAALISGIMGDIADTVVILLIVVINALIGFIQELKAEKAMNALKQMAEIKATVIRDGITQIIDAPNIVPGDILLLEAGNAVPADARLIATYGLKIEEAALTGESFAIEKNHLPLAKSQTYTLGDLTNMAFKGTFVTAGRAKAVVVSTGMQTELGKIAAMLQEADVMTPLQQRMQLFGKKLSVIVLLLCLLFLLIGWLRNEPIIQLLLTSISLAVAAIPEALPAVITISLALAAKRMIAFNSLIRKLPAVETLGSVTYICTDKTGTLTKNKMFVEALLLKEKAFNITEWKAIGFEQMEQQLLLNAMFSNNDAYQNNNGIWLGDSTEVALKELAVSCNNNYAALERVGEIAFDSDRKLMTTFHIYGNRIIAFTKGAPDILLEKCINNHGIYTASIDAFAAEGYRLIGFAYRIWDSLPTTLNAEKCETQLNFLGVAGLIDPPREEVFEAVHKCLKAGIVPVMITGDHPLTAETIARRIGIMTLPTDKVISGKELATLSDNDLQNQIKHIKVFARVSPEQKLQIVKCLQAQGEFVAMTGDGVNDAPSLKRANIGIAMGITGTDVSKEAADMILLDDNFSTIVKAIEEGRRIYDNILKFIKYLMTTNSGELWTLLLGPILGLPIALLPIHILWINLVSDGLPAISLSFEKAERNIMHRKPRSPQETVFANGRGLHMIWVGLLMAIIALLAQSWAIANHLHWQTIVFNVLCLSQMGHVLAIRSEHHSLFKIGIASNKPLLLSVIAAFVLQAMLTYIPFFQVVFRTEALTLSEFVIVGCISSLIFWAVELEKWISRIRFS